MKTKYQQNQPLGVDFVDCFVSFRLLMVLFSDLDDEKKVKTGEIEV